MPSSVELTNPAGAAAVPQKDNSQGTNVTNQQDSVPAQVNGNLAPKDSLRLIDEELESLIPYLKLAVENQQPVLVLQMWQRIGCAALLPFHLHLRWANLVPTLSLMSNFGLVPFFGTDDSYTSIPLYSVPDTIRARQNARSARFASGRSLSTDLYIPDWEQGCNNQRDELKEAILPGRAYIGVDVLSPAGMITKGHRPVLGRSAVRNAQRPFLLVPAKGGVTEVSAREFAEVDLLIVNIQGLRGQRAIESVQRAMRARGDRRPTLIIASSPTDIVALGLIELLERAQVCVLGTAPQLNDVKVAEVDQDRAIAERTFEFAVEELREKLEGHYILDLAKSAWWATRQSVDEERHKPEMQRFMSALERLSQEDPETARLLSHGKEVLSGAAANIELAQIRRRLVTDAALFTSGGAGTLVIARGCGIPRLRKEIAELLEVPLEVLYELGVRIQSHFSPPPSDATDLAIVAGYYGLATIDAMLMSHADKLHLVFDPVEARAAWYGVQKLIGCLKRLGVTEAIPTLEKLAAGIAEGIPAHLRSQATDVLLLPPSYDLFNSSGGQFSRGRRYLPVAEDEVTIYLTDGTELNARVNSRFDVLAQMGGRLRTVSAQELKPGDEIVLLQEDSRALFSDQLMRTLDDGVLRDAAAEREIWLQIVKSVYETQRPNLRNVTRRMAELGHPVNYATVRGWVTFADTNLASTPNQRACFLAFAEAFEIRMPEAELLKKFQGIRKLRIGHRAAGRHLARAIRAAYLNRLDAVSQERLKRDWGMHAFELVQSARVAVVDEVILPGGSESATE